MHDISLRDQQTLGHYHRQVRRLASPAAEHSHLEGGGSAAPGPDRWQSGGGAPAAEPPADRSSAPSATHTDTVRY